MNPAKVGFFIGMLIGTAIGALLGALILRWAVKIIAKFEIPYWAAYKPALVAHFSGNVIGVVVGYAVSSTGRVMSLAGYAVLLAIGFLMYAGIVSVMVKHPETGAIGIRKALLVTLIGFAVGAIVLAVIALLAYALMR